MSTFYAYAKNISDDWSYRYVIVFASSAVADEWWNAVSSATSTPFPASVKRITPQFYTHNPATANISTSITNSQVAAQFLGQVFFTLLNDRDGRILSIIPEQYVTSNINGNTYFIRSKVEPKEYWYCPGSSGNIVPGTGIRVSPTDRTRFRIHITNKPSDDKSIMIGSDDISITLPQTNLVIGVNELGSLIVGNNPLPDLKFSSFGKKFIAGASGAGGDVKALFETEDGEEWELV